jgi:hypothetical protein
MAGQLIPGMMAKPAPKDNFPATMGDVYKQTIGASSPIALPSQTPDQGYWDRLIGFIKSLMARR